MAMSASAVVKALRGVVLDSVEPPALARFYAELLGWEITVEDPTWVVVNGPGDGTHLSFQLEPELQRPKWPSNRNHQQMMIHLDFLVEDLPAATARVIELGGSAAEWQPQEHVRVCADPEGHIFCLFL
jgi:predicted enzyme related to lactoylglutathione lyase